MHSGSTLASSASGAVGSNSAAAAAAEHQIYYQHSQQLAAAAAVHQHQLATYQQQQLSNAAVAAAAAAAASGSLPPPPPYARISPYDSLYSGFDLHAADYLQHVLNQRALVAASMAAAAGCSNTSASIHGSTNGSTTASNSVHNATPGVSSGSTTSTDAFTQALAASYVTEAANNATASANAAAVAAAAAANSGICTPTFRTPSATSQILGGGFSLNSRKRALSASPYSDINLLDINSMIRYSPSSLLSLVSGSRSSSATGSYGHLSAGTLSPSLGAVNPLLMRSPSALFSGSLSQPGSGTTTPTALAAASLGIGALGSSHLAGLPGAGTTHSAFSALSGAGYHPHSHLSQSYQNYLLGRTDLRKSAQSPTTLNQKSTAFASSVVELSPISAPNSNSPKSNDASETASNVVSSTVLNDQSTAKRNSTSDSSTSSNANASTNRNSPTNNMDEDRTEEPGDFIETVCKWAGCNAGDFGVQADLVKHINKEHIYKKSVNEDHSKEKHGNVEHICRWPNCPRELKPFKAQYMLAVHVRSHTGEKPHRCTHPGCNKTYSRLENLKTHTRTHTGERPYHCEHAGCGKAFSNASDRAKHQNRTHSDAKPYQCRVDNCTKRYTDPSSLRKHVKTVHGEDAYKNKKHKGLSSREESLSVPSHLQPPPSHPTAQSKTASRSQSVATTAVGSKPLCVLQPPVSLQSEPSTHSTVGQLQSSISVKTEPGISISSSLSNTSSSISSTLSSVPLSLPSSVLPHSISQQLHGFGTVGTALVAGPGGVSSNGLIGSMVHGSTAMSNSNSQSGVPPASSGSNTSAASGTGKGGNSSTHLGQYESSGDRAVLQQPVGQTLHGNSNGGGLGVSAAAFRSADQHPEAAIGITSINQQYHSFGYPNSHVGRSLLNAGSSLEHQQSHHQMTKLGASSNSTISATISGPISDNQVSTTTVNIRNTHSSSNTGQTASSVENWTNGSAPSALAPLVSTSNVNRNLYCPLEIDEGIGNESTNVGVSEEHLQDLESDNCGPLPATISSVPSARISGTNVTCKSRNSLKNRLRNGIKNATNWIPTIFNKPKNGISRASSVSSVATTINGNINAAYSESRFGSGGDVSSAAQLEDDKKVTDFGNIATSCLLDSGSSLHNKNGSNDLYDPISVGSSSRRSSSASSGSLPLINETINGETGKRSSVAHPNQNVLLEECDSDKPIEQTQNLILPDEMMQYLNQQKDVPLVTNATTETSNLALPPGPMSPASTLVSPLSPQSAGTAAANHLLNSNNNLTPLISAPCNPPPSQPFSPLSNVASPGQAMSPPSGQSPGSLTVSALPVSTASSAHLPPPPPYPYATGQTNALSQTPNQNVHTNQTSSSSMSVASTQSNVHNVTNQQTTFYPSNAPPMYSPANNSVQNHSANWYSANSIQSSFYTSQSNLMFSGGSYSTGYSSYHSNYGQIQPQNGYMTSYMPPQAQSTPSHSSLYGVPSAQSNHSNYVTNPAYCGSWSGNMPQSVSSQPNSSAYSQYGYSNGYSQFPTNVDHINSKKGIKLDANNNTHSKYTSSMTSHQTNDDFGGPQLVTPAPSSILNGSNSRMSTASAQIQSSRCRSVIGSPMQVCYTPIQNLSNGATSNTNSGMNMVINDLNSTLNSLVEETRFLKMTIN